MPEIHSARPPLNELTTERMTVALLAGYFLDFEDAPLRDDPRFWGTILSYFEGSPELYTINPRPLPRRRLLDRLAESFRPEELGAFPELLKLNLVSVEALSEALRPIYENLSASSTSANSFLGSVVFDVWMCFEVLDTDQATKVWLRFVKEANPFLEEMLIGPINVDPEMLASVLGPAIPPSDPETDRPISRYHRDASPTSSSGSKFQMDTCMLDSLLVDPVNSTAAMAMRDVSSGDSSDESDAEEMPKSRTNCAEQVQNLPIATDSVLQESGLNSLNRRLSAEQSGQSDFELPIIDVSLAEDTSRRRANQSGNSVRGYAELAQARLAQNNVAAAFELVCEAFICDRRNLINAMRNSGRFDQTAREFAAFTEHSDSGSVNDLVSWLFELLNLYGPNVLFRRERSDFSEVGPTNCSMPGPRAQAINNNALDTEATNSSSAAPPRIPVISSGMLCDYFSRNFANDHERIVCRIQSLQAYLNYGEYPSSLREDLVYLRTHFGNLGVEERKQWIAPFCILNAKIWNAFGHQELCESYMGVAREKIKDSSVSVACDLALFSCFERGNPLMAIFELCKAPTELQNDYYEVTKGFIMTFALFQVHDFAVADIEYSKCIGERATIRHKELKAQVDILKYSLTGAHSAAAVIAQHRARSFNQARGKYMAIFYLIKSVRSFINANTKVSIARAQSLLQCGIFRSVANAKPGLLLELMLLRARLYLKLEKRKICFNICQHLTLLVRNCALPHLLFEWQVLRRLTCGDDHPDVSSFAIDPLLPSKCLYTEHDIAIASELANRFQIFTLYDSRKCKVPKDMSATMQQMISGSKTNEDWIAHVQSLYREAAEINRLDTVNTEVQMVGTEIETKAKPEISLEVEKTNNVRAVVERRAERMRANLRLHQRQSEKSVEEQREAFLPQKRDHLARIRSTDESSPTRFNRPKRLLSRNNSPRERLRKRRSTVEDEFSSFDSE